MRGDNIEAVLSIADTIPLVGEESEDSLRLSTDNLTVLSQADLTRRVLALQLYVEISKRSSKW